MQTKVVAKIDVVEMDDGTIGLANVQIKDHHTGNLRTAKSEAYTVKDFADDHNAIEPETIVFFKGNCVFFNGKWYW